MASGNRGDLVNEADFPVTRPSTEKQPPAALIVDIVPTAAVDDVPAMPIDGSGEVPPATAP